ncbi:protein of unknown function [Azospirillum baldaniorum]|uniref:Uncharacterized protein n=1 Tax=Azospirillum baldaniorum TaxID=1064539 RepID=A0A9P1JQV4_9PROT|nr:protein of unknown function [Azospirillum baldaniorum]
METTRHTTGKPPVKKTKTTRLKKAKDRFAKRSLLGGEKCTKPSRRPRRGPSAAAGSSSSSASSACR